MNLFTCVNLTCKDHTLDIVYDGKGKSIQFNKCVMDKNTEYSIKDIWVNEQPAEFLRKFRSTLINQSDFSHFNLTKEGIFLYFIDSNEVTINILEETKDILNKTERKIVQKKINLELLEVRGLEKILKLASDKSLFNDRGDHLENDYTLKECGVRAKAQLIIGDYVCSQNDFFDDTLNEIQINEVDVDPDFKSMNQITSLPKSKLASFSNGLNLMGECQDSDCEAFGRQICIQKKFGVFEINTICQELMCSCCDGKLSNVGGIFLNGCVYLITGTLKNGESRRSSLQNICSTKTKKLFDNPSQAALEWKNFTITVKELPVEKPTFPTGAQCVIGGSAILVAAYIFYNMNKNTK